jgi:predicted NAD/FAD-dependent oxidoreductase
MEHLAQLLNDKEKLMERVEELYEDNVMIKWLNDPSSLRSDYSRPFWAEMRQYLPEPITTSLWKSLKERRKIREESRKEALAWLQGFDVVLGGSSELLSNDAGVPSASPWAVPPVSIKENASLSNVAVGEKSGTSVVYNIIDLTPLTCSV